MSVQARGSTGYWSRPRDLVRALVVAAALLSALIVVSSASAKIVGSGTHKVSIMPSSVSGPSGMVCNNSCAAVLTYHGGPVMHATSDVNHAVSDYLIFWAPSGHYMPPAYKTGMAQWFTDVAKASYTPNNVFAVNQELYDLTGPSAAHAFTPYSIKNAGSIVDTTPYPASGCTDNDGSANLPVCLTDAQIQTELKNLVAAKGLPQNRSTMYFLFTPARVGSCFDSTNTQCAYSTYCAYHGFFTGTTGEIVYANMPWTFRQKGCDLDYLGYGAGYANGSAIDPEVSVTSHEASEAMTDPDLNAWYDSSGFENGDKCAYVYGSGGVASFTGVSNNFIGYWNQLISSDQYLMQQEYSLKASDCKNIDTAVQPAFTFTSNPTPPVHGSPATFSAQVTTATGGVNAIYWIWGDGTTDATGPSVTSMAHTYATSGTKSVQVILTDGFGHEKSVVKSFAVS
jgi:hypothetical protein